MSAQRGKIRVGKQQRRSEYVSIAGDDGITAKGFLKGWEQILDTIHQRVFGAEPACVRAGRFSIRTAEIDVGKLRELPG
jgi:hypothetical protein